MWVRVSRYYEFDFVPDILTKSYLQRAQILTDLNAKIRGIEAVLRKYRVDLSKCFSILSLYLNRLGALYCIKGNRKVGSMHFWKAIALNPFHLANYLHFLLSTLVPQTHKQVLESQQFTLDGITFY